MGCQDLESNFQAIIYKDGRWWASLGYTPTVTAPSREVVERHFEGYLPEYRARFELTQNADGGWTAQLRDTERS